MNPSSKTLNGFPKIASNSRECGRSILSAFSRIGKPRTASPRQLTSVDSTGLSYTGKTPSYTQYLRRWQLDGVLPDPSNSFTCISAISLFEWKDNARCRISTLSKVKKG